MAKLAPPPTVAPETWRALLAVAADFGALAPWEFLYDSDPVGLVDPVTGETRIGHVLGNAGEVFAAVFYRRGGLRWIFSMLDETPDPENLNNADGIDCLKVEFVPRHELWKEDSAVLKAAAFKSSLRPAGKAAFWPQFRSSEPGWHPWHITQAEAEQILADLPRLTAFCRLFQNQSDLYDDREATEIPFVPASPMNRPLTPGDLDWRPLVPPPITGLEPFRVPAAQLEKLRALKRQPGLACEFDCSILPGRSFLEKGRPCFGRFCLLVEKKSGMILSTNVERGALTPGEAAGRTLIEAVLTARLLPEEISIAGARLQPVLQPLCDELQIRLRPASSLPALEEAAEHLARHMLATGGLGGR